MSHTTLVTFEGTRAGQGGYAVVQRGTAKKIVTREIGLAILAGTLPIAFNDDRPQRRKRSGKSNTTKSRLSKVETMKVALGLDSQDSRLIVCPRCLGHGPSCQRCKGIGLIYTA